jgi:hypothetical protein
MASSGGAKPGVANVENAERVVAEVGVVDEVGAPGGGLGCVTASDDLNRRVAIYYRAFELLRTIACRAATKE